MGACGDCLGFADTKPDLVIVPPLLQLVVPILYDDIASYDDRMQYTMQSGTYLVSIGTHSRADSIQVHVDL